MVYVKGQMKLSDSILTFVKKLKVENTRAHEELERRSSKLHLAQTYPNLPYLSIFSQVIFYDVQRMINRASFGYDVNEKPSCLETSYEKKMSSQLNYNKYLSNIMTIISRYLL